MSKFHVVRFNHLENERVVKDEVFQSYSSNSNPYREAIGQFRRLKIGAINDF